MKITLGNHKYGMKKTTGGDRYITREFSKKGFKKYQEGKLENKSGIIEIPKISAMARALKNKMK